MYSTQIDCVRATAPLYVRCQELEIREMDRIHAALPEYFVGHGPARVIGFDTLKHIQLSCGCVATFTELPIWEQVACEKFYDTIKGLLEFGHDLHNG